MNAPPSSAAQPAVAVAPAEAVLPVMYYLVLGLELIGLIALQHFHPEASGSDPDSYALGWTGVASMLVMHVYSIRRRVRAFRNFGALRHWLHFHIFCGIQGAMLVTYHSWHTRNIRSLQGYNIVCVGVVVASGFFGRYLYSFLPRRIDGERLSAREVDIELHKLNQLLDHDGQEDITVPMLKFDEVAPEGNGSVLTLVREQLRIRSALGKLQGRLRTDGGTATIRALAETARVRLQLTSRRDTLAIAARLFARWTWFHRPLTFFLLALTMLHVFAHYVYGGH